MAPIFKGSTEIVPGGLKLGGKDVKEVYLGSEKIWPSGPPPGVDNILWQPGADIDPAPLNMVPTVTVTRNARVPSGTPPNIASTTATQNSSSRFQQSQLKVVATAENYYTAMQQPQMRIRFMVRDWVVSPTDLNCYIRITFGVGGSAPDYTAGAPKHRVEGELSFQGKKEKIIEQSGAYFGGSGTFTTTQTIGEYIENRQYLDFTHTWTEGATLQYNRYVGSCVSNFDIAKIEAIAAGRRRPIRDSIKRER